MRFSDAYEEWVSNAIAQEQNSRRRERLQQGIGHGTLEFLRLVWFPAVGNFSHLHAEWEVRDFHNGYRYLDLAYIPDPNTRCGIEIQGYGPHARDLDVRRFKDLCWRHCLLALDGWLLLPIAYPAITEEPKRCQQLVLAFIGKFMAMKSPLQLNYIEAEVIRFARRQGRPFAPDELAQHLRVSNQRARKVLHSLVGYKLMEVAAGKQRYRMFSLREG